MTLCATCRQPFQPSKTWHRECWDCWREQRDRGATSAAYQQGYEQGFTEGRIAGYDAARDASPLPPLGDLIALTHPDRHPQERAALANAITADLLALRHRAANGGSGAA